MEIIFEPWEQVELDRFAQHYGLDADQIPRWLTVAMLIGQFPSLDYRGAMDRIGKAAYRFVYEDGGGFGYNWETQPSRGWLQPIADIWKTEQRMERDPRYAEWKRLRIKKIRYEYLLARLYDHYDAKMIDGELRITDKHLGDDPEYQEIQQLQEKMVRHDALLAELKTDYEMLFENESGK